MRQVVASVLLVIFLFTGTEFSQVLRLPSLVAHFFDHAAEEDLSIAEFLYMHYAANSAHGHQHERDSQLPFKSGNGHHAQLSLMLPAAHPEWPVFIAEGMGVAAEPAEAPFVDGGCARMVWQPPKSTLNLL
jgi:hypothetical protein